MNAAVVYWSGTGNTEAMHRRSQKGFRQQEEPRRYVRLDRQMRIRFQNLIKLRSAARLWEQSSRKTAKWSRSWKNWSR